MQDPAILTLIFVNRLIVQARSEDLVNPQKIYDLITFTFISSFLVRTFVWIATLRILCDRRFEKSVRLLLFLSYTLIVWETCFKFLHFSILVCYDMLRRFYETSRGIVWLVSSRVYSWIMTNFVIREKVSEWF